MHDKTLHAYHREMHMTNDHLRPQQDWVTVTTWMYHWSMYRHHHRLDQRQNPVAASSTLYIHTVPK